VGGRSTRAAVRLAGISLVVLAAVSAAAAAPPGPRDASVLQARTHAALLDLYALDTRLHNAQARLATLQSQAAQLRKQQVQLAQQLSATRGTLQTSQRRLAENLRTLYEQGEVDPLAVVLGAQSLDEALTKLDDLTRVADQSRQFVVVTSAAQSKLVQIRTSLADRRARLNVSIVSARRTADDLAAAHTDRVAFIGTLQLKARQLTALQAAAQRVEAKSQRLQAAASVLPPNPATGDAPSTTPAVTFADAPAAAPVSGGRTITVSSTGYSLPGRTATGMPVGWGVVAVDPSLIPLGTRLTIPGYGEGVAADTGGAVRGATIDLWFPSHAQALGWGRRTVTITLH
jgi:3D (Asp-Asp-Asp) domain-containing protein